MPPEAQHERRCGRWVETLVSSPAVVEMPNLVQEAHLWTYLHISTNLSGEGATKANRWGSVF